MNNQNPSVNSHSGFTVPSGRQPQRPVLRCSFCGLGEGEVARLFEGQAGYICDECVDVCIQLLHDFREMGMKPRKQQQPWYKKLLGDDAEEVGLCGFNVHDRTNPQGDRLFPGINAHICEKCIRACEMLKSSLVLGS